MLLGYHRLRMPYLITRRSFGKLLAAVPLARAFAPLARASSENRNMFLSLNSVLLQGRVHWPEFARLAAQTGFPRTDIMLRPAMEAGASATNDLLAGLKIRPAVIEFPVEFRKDDATFKASLTQLDAAAQFAAAIHCPRMMTYIMASSDTPKDELRQTYKQRFTESARILARYNVRLGLEFLGLAQFVFWCIAGRHDVRHHARAVDRSSELGGCVQLGERGTEGGVVFPEFDRKLDDGRPDLEAGKQVVGRADAGLHCRRMITYILPSSVTP